MIVLDFETRSRIDITEAGVSKYLSCPDFGVLVVALKFDDAPAVAIYRGNPQNWAINQELIRRIEVGELIVAHNVGFDYRVYCKWRKHMRWPETHINQWVCTQTAAMAAGLPSKLGLLGNTFGLGSKKASGTKLINQLSIPDKKTGEFSDDWAKLKPFVDYALRDVELTHQVLHRLAPIALGELRSPVELAVQEADYRINTKGVGIDDKAVDAAIQLSDSMEQVLNETVNRITDGAVKSTTDRNGLLAYTQRWYPTAKSVDKTACETLMQLSHTPPELRQVIKIRQAAGNTSVKKYQKMRSMALHGRARDTLRLYGAFTGRWAGRGIQTQNLPRGDFDDHDNASLAHSLHHTGRLPKGVPWGRGLAAAIRGCIIPAPGNRLIASDYNAIECRVLAWLAGEEWLVNLFQSGEDPYKPMAAQILGKPVELVTKAERAKPGKATVLGCGYQMGFKRFAAENKVSEDFAALCVNTYRTMNPMTKRLWYGVQTAAAKAISNPGRAYSYFAHAGLGTVCDATMFRPDEGRSPTLTYQVQGEFLTCLLPSGRKLYYWRPHCDWQSYGEGEDLKPVLSYWGKSQTGTSVINIHTYGGALVENCCQAIARDIIVNGILNAHARGLKVVLQVHDEIVIESPLGVANDAMKTLEACMVAKAPWMSGLPLAVESWIGERYKK